MNTSVQIRAQLGALDLNVTLRLGPEPLALIGPNGSGKTTLLRILCGALRPDAGRIEVDGRVLLDTQRQIDLAIENRRIGYVPQGYGLFPHLSVLDNVSFGLGQNGRSRRQARDAAMEVLTELGCAHLASRRPTRLSGGERQRVALARALATSPDILLLDEPLAALDPRARRSVRTLLATHLRRLHKPSIVVTHDVRDVRALGATVAVVEAGRIRQHAKLCELEATPADEFVAEFLG